ncbi:hypothetical protein [Aeromicrobium sp. 179-A 4D2 NHS]|uniref:hypothetical protein n=1 Tax=Aeromicrobium sp. 179-A 4D2 NHS TaxID=3142375 RepID=UPI0039A0D83C
MSKPVNVTKGKQGFQTVERSEPASLGLPHTPTRVTTGGTITSTCGVCGETETAPDKGLGRAKVAAWETRHQH